VRASNVFIVRHCRFMLNNSYRYLTSSLALWMALLVFAGAWCSSIESAQARSGSWRRHHYSGHHTSKRAKKKNKRPAPSGPLFAVVSIGDQRVTVYDASGVVARASVSTGMPGHRTPTGIFSIIQKQRMHHSNLYSGAPMPYMQRITWSGVAMHAGHLPGYPASHGCIRLPHGFASRIYWMTRIGQRVVVSAHDITPVNMSHGNLPVPTLQPEPAQTAVPKTTGQLARADDAVDPEQKTDAPEPSLPASTVKGATPRRLNPIEYAQNLKAEAAARVAAAAEAVKAADKAIVEKVKAARKASTEFREVDDAVREIDSALAAARRKIDRAQEEKTRNEETISKSASLKASLEAELPNARKRIDEARRNTETRKQELADARKALKDARASLEAAVRAAHAAERVASKKKGQARRAIRRFRRAEGVVKSLDARRVKVAARFEAAKSEKAAKRAAKAAGSFEARLAEARTKLEEARKIKEAKEKDHGDARRAADEANTAVEMAKAVETKASGKVDEARAATRAVESAETAMKEMELRLADAVRKSAQAHIELAQNEETLKKAAETRAELEARLAKARKISDELLKVKEAKDRELATARDAVNEAKAKSKAAVAALKEANRRLEPVSILISRKTGKVHVRQAFQRLFDAPMTITDPERPLGTHLFIATQAAEDGASLRWAAMSMGSTGHAHRRHRKHSRRRSARKDKQEETADAPDRPVTAAGALDRIKIPEEAARRISELSWVGASVIVTDYGISGETGAHTDFVILTRSRGRRR
jgi:hypothetical protein